MADEAIDLENMRIRYDSKTGSFRLSSLDSRFRGKPFVLTVSRDSPTMKTLLEVFRQEGLIPAESGIPADVGLGNIGNWVNGLDEYSIANSSRPMLRDSRLLLPFGVATEGPVAMDLGFSPHSLITGQHGDDARRLLTALRVFAHDEGRECRVVIGADDPGALANRDRSRVATDELLDELHSRLEVLDGAGKMDYIEYESKVGAMPPVFVFSEAVDKAPGSFDWLAEILDQGERAGFFLFATVDSVFDLPPLLDDSLFLNFGRRISFGQDGLPAGMDPGQFEQRGRGILRVENSVPRLLQFLQSH